ncbi:MAG: PAS domain-containing protein [Rhodospirillales bacterium]|nr:PAS domain-containing protein [Rhodospirillales bacterium]
MRQLVDDTVIWDSRTEAIFGMEPGTFTGSRAVHFDLIHPEDLDKIDTAYELSISAGAAYEVDYRIVLPGGEIRHVASRGSIITDGEGRPTQVTGVTLDVTEQKKAEEALRESEGRFQAFLQYTTSAITMKNRDGEFLMANATYKQWAGLGEADIESKNLKDIFPPQLAKKILDNDRRVFESKKPNSEERYLDFVHGDTRTVISHKFPMFNDNGEVYAVGTILTDQSERLRAEEAESANQTKSEFLASMSHEIRTPLNAILGFAQLMDTSLSEPPTESQKVSLEQILSGGGHLLSLIDEILDLAKIESGNMALAVEAVDIGDIITECIASTAQLGRDKGVAIVNHTANQALPAVKIDSTRFRQVLLNLLSNAVKYNLNDGKVFIGFEQSDPDMARIIVTDTGPGISPERQKELFVPFSRLGREASDVPGTGIGLTITKKLVEAMNGRIGFESRPGQGSSFWFEIPIADTHPCPPADIRPSTKTHQLLGKQTILYVEDSRPSQKLMEALIGQRTQATMLCAETGELGLEMAKEYLPDLILMDINLPRLNGFEALASLRSFQPTSQIPVIALTARAMPEDVNHGLKAGFLAYLTKPIQIDQVLEAIESALA